MNNLQENIRKYAELIVKKGINLQKGQTLVINSSIEGADFVRKLAKSAYGLGAKNVHVEYSDEKLGLIKYMNAPEEAFNDHPQWKADGFAWMAENDYAFLSLTSANPDLLKDVDPKRLAAANKAAGLALGKFRNYINNSTVSWCVAAIPSLGWARKVFPDLPADQAFEKLWDNILQATRADREDPIKAWDKHLASLNKKLEYLNKNKIKRLIYKSAETDLQVDLPQDHIWLGGGEENSKGVYFIANMPTEEIFTAPLKNGVNGYVKNTKPLSYNGNLIDDFTLWFKDGKVVDFKAEKGEESLKHLIETDEGSRFLGEVALVPYDSPVSNTEIIFYNTLFDENASCHFALGSAYPINIKGGSKMSQEELEENNINISMSHVDFMVGSKDMNIDGILQTGEKLAIFKKGNWAF